MNKKPLTTLDAISIIIAFIFLMYGSYLVILANDSKTGKVMIFISIISFSFIFFKQRIKL